MVTVMMQLNNRIEKELQGERQKQEEITKAIFGNLSETFSIPNAECEMFFDSEELEKTGDPQKFNVK